MKRLLFVFAFLTGCAHAPAPPPQKPAPAPKRELPPMPNIAEVKPCMAPPPVVFVPLWPENTDKVGNAIVNIGMRDDFDKAIKQYQEYIAAQYARCKNPDAPSGPDVADVPLMPEVPVLVEQPDAITPW